jgi:dihydropteroate synthase
MTKHLRPMNSISQTEGKTLKLGDADWPIGGRCGVFGVVNITPDSFSDGGHYYDPSEAVRRGEALAKEGADVIDIGGESTRPGFEEVSIESEIRRVVPVIESLSRSANFPPISIDTYKPGVARAAIAAGATVVNDIWGFRKEPDLADIVAESRATCVLMHNSRDGWLRDGTLDSIKACWEQSVGIALERGVPENCIVLDPGIGFTDTRQQDIEIINGLGELRECGFPILLGASRKRVTGEALGLKVDERLETTLAISALAIDRGVDFIRVHDVLENVRVSRMLETLRIK